MQGEGDIGELFALETLDLHERFVGSASRPGADAEVRPEAAEH